MLYFAKYVKIWKLDRFIVKVLCVSDKVVDFLYSASVKTMAEEVDFILACGDLPYYYLEFLISMLNIPLFYVHGNHDSLAESTASGERITGPGGGINLDGQIVQYKGLLIGGLEGCLRYRPNSPFQYSDLEMWGKLLKMVPKLFYHRAVKGRAIDIFITHAPPLNIHNGKDHVHQGFTSFLWLMRQFQPKYFFHGHYHVYRRDEQTITQYHQTMVHNIYPYKLIELDASWQGGRVAR